MQQTQVSEDKVLIVPAEVYWRKYLNTFESPGCSGLGDCDNCNRKMYSHRIGYLRSWINVYLKK